LLIVALAVVLGSCDPSGGDGTTDLGTDTGTDDTQATKVKISFTLPAGSGADECYVVDIATGSQALVKQALVAGLNTLELPIGKTYSIGFSAGGSASLNIGLARGAAVGPTTVAKLKINAAGLDSIPLGTNATAEINLGDLSLSPGLLVAQGPSAAQMAGGTGHPEQALNGYGKWDNVLNKFQNININRNGQWDGEESVEWSFSTQNAFNANLSRSDFDSGNNWTAVLADFTPDYVAAHISVKDPALSGITLSLESASLILPENLDIQGNGIFSYTSGSYDHSGSFVPVTSLVAKFLTLGSDGTVNFNFQFDVETNLFPPYNGDYRIELAGHDPYFFDAMQFVNFKADVDEILLPVVMGVLDADRKLLRVDWLWVKRNGLGEVSTPTKEELELMVSNWYFGIPEDVPSQNNYTMFFEPGELSGSYIPDREIIVRDNGSGGDCFQSTVTMRDGSTNFTQWNVLP